MKVSMMLMILSLSFGLVLFGSNNVAAAPGSAVTTLLKEAPALIRVGGNDNEKEGCNANKLSGTYATTTFSGALNKTFVYQFNFGRNGSLYSYFTGSLEQPNLLGLDSPGVGSWECLKGNTLVFTYISGLYSGTGTDTELSGYYRYTMVYKIENGGDNLKRIRRVRKCFLPEEDPTDPNGVPGCGTQETTNDFPLKRLKPFLTDLDTP